MINIETDHRKHDNVNITRKLKRVLKQLNHTANKDAITIKNEAQVKFVIKHSTQKN